MYKDFHFSNYTIITYIRKLYIVYKTHNLTNNHAQQEVKFKKVNPFRDIQQTRYIIKEMVFRFGKNLQHGLRIVILETTASRVYLA